MKKSVHTGRVKPDVLASEITTAAAVFPVALIVCGRIIRDALYAGMLMPAMLMHLCVCLLWAVVLRKRLALTIRSWFQKKRLQNMDEEMRRALRKSLLPTIAAGLVPVFLSAPVSRLFSGTGRGYLAVAVSGATLFIPAAGGILQAYLDGCEKGKLSVIADMIRAVLLLFLMPAGAVLGAMYGGMADDLLFTSDLRPCYAAFGTMLGLALAQGLHLLVLAIMRHRVRRKLYAQPEYSDQRYLTNPSPFYRPAAGGLLAALLPFAAIFSGAFLFVSGAEEEADALCMMTGAFAGKYLTLTVLLSLLSILPFMKTLYRIAAWFNKEGAGAAAERFHDLVHSMAVLFFPVAAFVMALARPLVIAVFAQIDDTAVQLLSRGGLWLPFLSFAMVLTALMVMLRRHSLLMINAGIAAGVFLISGIILFRVLRVGIIGMPVMLILMTAVYDIAAVCGLCRLTGLRLRRLVLPVAVPLLIAALAGVLIRLLSGALVDVVGDALAVMVGVFIGSIVCLIALRLTNGLNEEELAAIPAASIPGWIRESLSKRLGRGGNKRRRRIRKKDADAGAEPFAEDEDEDGDA